MEYESGYCRLWHTNILPVQLLIFPGLPFLFPSQTTVSTSYNKHRRPSTDNTSCNPTQHGSEHNRSGDKAGDLITATWRQLLPRIPVEVTVTSVLQERRQHSDQRGYPIPTETSDTHCHDRPVRIIAIDAPHRRFTARQPSNGAWSIAKRIDEATKDQRIGRGRGMQHRRLARAGPTGGNAIPRQGAVLSTNDSIHSDTPCHNTYTWSKKVSPKGSASVTGTNHSNKASICDNQPVTLWVSCRNLYSMSVDDLRQTEHTVTYSCSTFCVLSGHCGQIRASLRRRWQPTKS